MGFKKVADLQDGKQIGCMLVRLSEEAKREHGNGIVTPRPIQRHKERLAVLLRIGIWDERSPEWKYWIYPCFKTFEPSTKVGKLGRSDKNRGEFLHDDAGKI
jgi:hypothetical protein